MGFTKQFLLVVLLIAAVSALPRPKEDIEKLKDFRVHCANLCQSLGGKGMFVTSTFKCECAIVKTDDIDAHFVKKRADLLGMSIQLKQSDLKENTKRSVGGSRTTTDAQGEHKSSPQETTTLVTMDHSEDDIPSVETTAGQKPHITPRNDMPENVESKSTQTTASSTVKSATAADVLGSEMKPSKEITEDDCCILKGRNARSPNENKSGSSTPIVGSQQNSENGKQEPTVGQRPPVPHRRPHVPHLPRARRPNPQHHQIPHHQTPQIHHPRRMRPHHQQIVSSIRERIAGLKTPGGSSGGSKDMATESRIGKASDGNNGLAKLRQREPRKQILRRNKADEPKQQEESVLGSRHNAAAEESNGRVNPQILITPAPDFTN